jgi:hypothetical protein
MKDQSKNLAVTWNADNGEQFWRGQNKSEVLKQKFPQEGPKHHQWMYGRFGTNNWTSESAHARGKELVGLRYKAGNSNLRKAGAMSLSVDRVSIIQARRRELAKESEIAELLGKMKPKNDHNYLRKFGHKFRTQNELPPAGGKDRYRSLDVPTPDIFKSGDFDEASEFDDTSIASRGSRKKIVREGVKRPKIFGTEVPKQKRQVYLPTSVGNFAEGVANCKGFNMILKTVENLPAISGGFSPVKRKKMFSPTKAREITRNDHIKLDSERTHKQGLMVYKIQRFDDTARMHEAVLKSGTSNGGMIAPAARLANEEALEKVLFDGLKTKLAYLSELKSQGYGE